MTRPAVLAAVLALCLSFACLPATRGQAPAPSDAGAATVAPGGAPAGAPDSVPPTASQPASVQPSSDQPASDRPASDQPAAAAPGSRTVYRPDAEGGWAPVAEPAAGSDAARIAAARRALAEDRPREARTILSEFIRRTERTDNPLLAEAYLLRGDATSAAGNEYKALYDYEMVIRAYPGSAEFVTANERELEIAVRYIAGLRRKFLGLRISTAVDEGEELLIRVQERMPGSRLAERAGIELADHYYRNRELKLASESYELFLQNYPNSPYRMKAMQRRVYANIGRFKGPKYDASPLTDAKVLIQRFRSLYAAQAEQAGLDEALLTRIDESAAAQLLEVAKWYLRRDDPVSARFTLRRLVRLHPSTAAAARALDFMTERGWLVAEPAAGAGDGAAPPADSANPPAPAEGARP